MDHLADADWKFLIILDACRYDYFNKIYRKYLKGEVEKRISPTCHTIKWVNKMFPDYYDDIVYIASIPYINSKEEVFDKYGVSYDAKKHFFKVIDNKWTTELKTVTPDTINDKVKEIIKLYPDKRIVIHYLQPHNTYIGENYKKYINLNYKQTNTSKAISKLPIQLLWFIARVLNKKNLRQPMLIGKAEGTKGIRKAYEENLNLVLSKIKELLPNLDGKIIITADHGEYLGEHGLYGHLLKKRKKEVYEIPYLELIT